MNVRQANDKSRSFERREMVQRRLKEERQHDAADERTEVASYQAMMSRLNRMQSERAERCPACGEPADDCQPYLSPKGRKMLLCPICKTCVPDRRGAPVPREITRALQRQRMEMGEG